jgi:hypothetical protein
MKTLALISVILLFGCQEQEGYDNHIYNSLDKILDMQIKLYKQNESLSKQSESLSKQSESLTVDLVDLNKRAAKLLRYLKKKQQQQKAEYIQSDSSLHF